MDQRPTTESSLGAEIALLCILNALSIGVLLLFYGLQHWLDVALYGAHGRTFMLTASVIGAPSLMALLAFREYKSAGAKDAVAVLFYRHGALFTAAGAMAGGAAILASLILILGSVLLLATGVTHALNRHAATKLPFAVLAVQGLLLSYGVAVLTHHLLS